MAEIDRPVPGEELTTTGEPTAPRPAATVILLRDTGRAPEILMVRRTPRARFMGGIWVFPGGAVDPHEGEGDAALRAAALRELEEEAGIRLPSTDELVLYSRWITPRQIRIRFDTWFFLAPAPAGVEPRIDGQETVDARWYSPAAALEAYRRGDIRLAFPTIRHLEQLSPFATAGELLAHARSQQVRPVEPRVVREGEVARVLLPGEPGYDD
jgi:8-oxo-dGTP pyrophosphatase MutT (NUDIX family)